MVGDIVEKLRKPYELLDRDYYDKCQEAADEIERLRAALQTIRNHSRIEVRETQSPGTVRGCLREVDRIAREALEQQEDGDG